MAQTNQPQVGDQVRLLSQVTGAVRGAEGVIEALFGAGSNLCEVRITNHNMTGRVGLSRVVAHAANLEVLNGEGEAGRSLEGSTRG